MTVDRDNIDDEFQVSGLIEERMKAEIMEYDKKLDETGVLAILLKYRKEHREALDDIEVRYCSGSSWILKYLPTSMQASSHLRLSIK